MTRTEFRTAFTLIEVMVAVMIISVVIMALVRMHSNNNYLFSSYKQHTTVSQYSTLLIANQEYGFENKNLTLNDLAQDFDLDDDLRRELKSQKVELKYKMLRNIDLSEESNASATQLFLEVGSDILKVNNESIATLRLRLQ